MGPMSTTQPSTRRHLHLHLRPIVEDLGQLLDCIANFAAENHLDALDSYAIALAAEELFAHTVEHGGPDPFEASIEVDLRLGERRLTLTYSDAAPAFDPTTAPASQAPADPAPAADQANRPGSHFLPTISGSIHYVREQGRNYVALTRHLGSDASH